MPWGAARGVMVRPRAAIVSANLLREYRCDDGTGTQVTDYSGNAHHGTFSGGAAAPSWSSEGVLFGDSDTVTAPTTGLPTGDADLTMCTVSKFGDSATIFQWGGIAANRVNFAIRHLSTTQVDLPIFNDTLAVTVTGGAFDKWLFCCGRYRAADNVVHLDIPTTGNSGSKTLGGDLALLASTCGWNGHSTIGSTGVGTVAFSSVHTRRIDDIEVWQMYYFSKALVAPRGIAI